MKLQLKRSNVLDGGAAKKPTALQMEYGELAVNYNNGDPAIFIKDSNDNIIRIAGVGNISSGDTPSGDTLPPTGNNVGDIFFNTLNETLYYWDGSQWVPIANDTTAADIFVGTLTEINTQVPEVNRRNGFLWWNTEDGTLYVWYIDTDTSQWVIAVPASGGGGSGASVTVLDAPPTTPEQGDLWWNTTDGRLYVWYEDGDTNQWVDASPSSDDGLWLENSGYLSPKDETNGVELGSGAISLDAADGSGTFVGNGTFGDYAGQNGSLILSRGQAIFKRESLGAIAVANLQVNANVYGFACGSVDSSGNTDYKALINIDGNCKFDGNIQSTSQNGGQLAGFRNQLINGDFRIWQRYDGAITDPSGNTGQYGVTITSANRFGCDRWQSRNPTNSGGSVAHLRLNGSTNGLRLDVAGSTSYQLVETRLERADLFQLNDKTVTLSLNCSRSTVRARVKIYAGDGTGTEIVSSTDAPTSLGNDMYSWTFNISPNIGAGANNQGNGESNDMGMQITLYPDGLNTVNGQTDFKNVQLEPGPVATPFEHRPIGTELALCQRYYQTVSSLMPLVRSSDVAQRSMRVPRTTTMRVSPTETGTITNTSTSNIFSSTESEIRIFAEATNAAGVVTITDYIADAEL